MLSFTIRRSSRSAAISCRTGATTRQGPHQGAQKSTSTGVSDSMTSAWKLLSVTSVMLPAIPSPLRRLASESIAWDSARQGEQEARRDPHLDGAREQQNRDRDRGRDEGGGEQLLPALGPARQRPGGEREEEREQLGQRVRQDAEHQQQRRDAEVGRQRRGVVAERVGLRHQREDGRAGHERDRQRAGEIVDAPPDPAVALGDL